MEQWQIQERQLCAPGTFADYEFLLARALAVLVANDQCDSQARYHGNIAFKTTTVTYSTKNCNIEAKYKDIKMIQKPEEKQVI